MNMKVFLFTIGIVEIICGIILLQPWYKGTATYTHPELAFYVAIFFVFIGVFMTCNSLTINNQSKPN